MKKDFNQSSKSGFAPLLVIIVMVVVLSAGIGGYVFVAKEKKTAPPEKSEISTETVPASPVITAANPKELLGWWEEEGGFPFMKEFSEEYFCVQYSSRSTCADNVRYRVEGNKILLEGQSGFYSYATWKMVGEKLELNDGQGSSGKALYKKISSPTSKSKITAPAVTRPGLSEKPKANIKLLKVGESGVCLKHDGGDSITITRLGIKRNGNSISIQSLQQFPSLIDYIFDSGEFFILAGMPPPPEKFITFRVGDAIEIFTDTPSGFILLDSKKIDKIEPRDEDAPVLIGGLASCP